jgi:hypothetical protein
MIPADNGAIYAVYDRYCRFGETGSGQILGLTSRNFAKLAKDCELVDRKITTTVLDLAFTKAKIASVGQSFDAASKKLNYEQFLVALELCAAEKNVSVRDLHSRIAAHAAEGPVVNATIAEPNKFHDDKSTYTAALRGSHKPLSRKDSISNLPTPTKPTNPAALHRVFETYSRFGETGAASGLTNRNLVKLFKDCGLEDKIITPTLLDISFTKAARAPIGLATSGSASGNRINHEQFLVVVHLCAHERGVSAAELHERMIAHAEDGPIVTATIAEPNKFHDDKSTYTANLRGEHKPLSRGDSGKTLPVPIIPEDHQRVLAVFERYARFGETAGPSTLGMTNRNLVKLFKDCGLADEMRVSPTLLDVSFAKAKHALYGRDALDASGSNRINYEQFLVVLELVALDKQRASHDLHVRIAAKAHTGPTVHATIAEPNKFHDDKSTYTANLRGEHKPLSRGDSINALPTVTRPIDGAALLSVFDRFSRFGETGAAPGMTSRNLVKLFKDTSLIDPRRLTVTFLDIAFTKAARAPVGESLGEAGSKRINYEQFLLLLELCALERGASAHDLHAALIRAAEAGPMAHATFAEPNKFHDDKSTYTANLRGEHKPLSRGDSSKALPPPKTPTDSKKVQLAFEIYARFGETATQQASALGLTSRNFVKLFKDCELLDKKITTTFLDLAFTKAKNAPGGIHTMGVDKSNKISYLQFLVAIELCAQETGKPADWYCNAIAHYAEEGPVVTATIAEPNKFHDDKSTYTAVAANVHVGLKGSPSAGGLKSTPSSTTSSRRASLSTPTGSNTPSKAPSRKQSGAPGSLASATRAAAVYR